MLLAFPFFSPCNQIYSRNIVFTYIICKQELLSFALGIAHPTLKLLMKMIGELTSKQHYNAIVEPCLASSLYC